jgi:hypothetical protein
VPALLAEELEKSVLANAQAEGVQKLLVPDGAPPFSLQAIRPAGRALHAVMIHDGKPSLLNSLAPGGMNIA